MRVRSAGALLLGGSVFVVFVSAFSLTIVQNTVNGPSLAGAGTALWVGRTGEALFQALIILSGVFSILLLLAPEKPGGGNH